MTIKNIRKEASVTIKDGKEEITIVFKRNFGKPFIAVWLPQTWKAGKPKGVAIHKGVLMAYKK